MYAAAILTMANFDAAGGKWLDLAGVTSYAILAKE